MCYVCVFGCVYYNHLVTITMTTTTITMITIAIKIAPTTPPIISPISPPEGSLVLGTEEEEEEEEEDVIVPKKKTISIPQGTCKNM